MEAAANYGALCTTLRSLTPGSLIAIEGFCSSGKSTLADRLSADIPAQVLHTEKKIARAAFDTASAREKAATLKQVEPANVKHLELHERGRMSRSCAMLAHPVVQWSHHV
jgi:cytidylate kinase